MSESQNRKDSKKFQPTEEWFETDPVAFEIRNICGRIINSYRDYMRSGDDSVGLVPLDAQKKTINELGQAFRDLEEFDVTPRKLSGKEPEFYYKNPRNMADYVAGQLLNLRDVPLISDMERNRDADSLDLEDNIADKDQVWPVSVQNMRLQVGSIDTAASFLGFDKPDEGDD